MNPVLILTHNCLELTKKCVESVRAQDVSTEIFLWDNGSTDGTQEWSSGINVGGVGCNVNKGVSYAWNHYLSTVFDGYEGSRNVFPDGTSADHVLVLNNDTIIPPWFYRSLLSYNVPFITGVSVSEMDKIATPPRTDNTPTTGPDFSAFLIRREAWNKIGPFDENMVHYCSDLDYDIRAHRAGMKLLNSHVPFYHERSSTLKNADPKDRRNIELRADADREVLAQKWNCADGGASFERQFAPELFGVDAG